MYLKDNREDKGEYIGERHCLWNEIYRLSGADNKESSLRIEWIVADWFNEWKLI